LFLPIASCIKRGDLAGFDQALAAGEDEFVKRRIYLTLERGRDIAMRNLFRKVFIAGGFDPLKEGEERPVRRSRVPIAEFAVAIRFGSQIRKEEILEQDEVECFLANMIYKVCFASLFSMSESTQIRLPATCKNCVVVAFLGRYVGATARHQSLAQHLPTWHPPLKHSTPRG